MLSFLIGCFVFLAIIALIWGRDAAQGCAEMGLRGIGYLIGIALLICAMAFLHFKFGVTNHGFVVIWLCVVGVFLIGFTWSAIDSRIKSDQFIAKRDSQRRVDEAQAATKERRTEENARIALRSVQNRRAQLPDNLAKALSNPRHAYHLCREAQENYGCSLVAWVGDEDGGQASPFMTYGLDDDRIYSSLSEEDKAHTVRFTASARDAELRNVFKALEAAVQDTDTAHEGRAVGAILALSAFAVLEEWNSSLTSDYPTQRAVRYLENLVWDTTVSEMRRVAALLSLGVMGSAKPSSLDENVEDSLAAYARADDAEVRAATACALGMKLWSSLASSRRLQTSPWGSCATMLSDEERDERHKRHERYEATVGALLVPLLHDPDGHVRCVAAQTMRCGESATFRDALRTAATDTAEGEIVREAARRSLQDLGDVPPDPAFSPDAYPPQLDAAIAYVKDYAQRHHIDLSAHVSADTSTTAAETAPKSAESAKPKPVVDRAHRRRERDYGVHTKK